MQQAKVTILGEAVSREITLSNGKQKTVWSQKASIETEAMRIGTEVEIDGKNDAHRIGAVYLWDVAADLVPGRFGRLELARRMSLVPAPVEGAKPRAVAGA